MSFDPTAALIILASAFSDLYLGWASLNCLCRKEQQPRETAGKYATMASRNTDETLSAWSCIDGQLVSWERLQQPSEVRGE